MPMMVSLLGRIALFGSAMVLFVSCIHRPPPAPPEKTIPKTVIHVQEITIEQIHLGLRSGSFSCENLIQTYLQRIERFDQPRKLNALVYINPKALPKAKRLDTEWHQEKKLRELHCIPIILNDNFDTADMPTTAGSKVLRHSYPPDDAYMVRRLRDAGAIILAKSNMSEWGLSPWFTISATAGTTPNPYDLSRVPAGSSGGAAAAVAANFATVGMATDTGHSLRGPASHTALVGIRATIGASSRDGIVPMLRHHDVAGPLTRTVEDAARIFNVIVGYDPADPTTREAIKRLPADYTAFLIKNGLRNTRMGVMRVLSNSQTTDREIKALFEFALGSLRRLGTVLVDPFIIDNFAKHRSANNFCNTFRWDVNKYFLSLGAKAPLKDFMQIVTSGNYHPSSQKGIDWVIAAKSPPERQDTPCLSVAEDSRRSAFLSAVLQAMDKYKVDAIVYPSWSNAPRKIDDLSSPYGNNSPLISPHTGQPSITVPMGFTREHLPTGLQFLGRPFAEGKLFQFAYAYEQATQHRKPPKLFAD